jgi:Zn-dependent M28 family amino/carboxypeptidase
MIRILATFFLAAATLLSPAPAAAATSPYAAAMKIAKVGQRTAGSAAERRAQNYVAGRFRSAGLAVESVPFRVPGHGSSQNVIGIYETPKDCLEIYMAHSDSVAGSPGGNDNASGLGVVAALAERIAGLQPDCDVWLVATGAEEREFTGTSYHVGAQALVDLVRERGRGDDLRHALSLDMLGRGKRFYLRSPQPAVRGAVEGQMLAAARRAKVTLRWSRDSSTGNSDHREFELAGLPAAVIQVWRGTDACHHEACDRPSRIQKGALNRVMRIATELIRGPRTTATG